jgi:hypothetical protein
MKIKTSELTGAALDWAVSIAEGFRPEQLYINKWSDSDASIYTRKFDDEGSPDGYITGPDRMYSRKWEAGGPIIEREKIVMDEFDGLWGAGVRKDGTLFFLSNGPTPLIAAMRCYVASKLGDKVDVPEELK